MKKKSSIVSLILALCLCLAMAVPAFAADDQVRMIDVENDLLEYLAEYQPDIVFGSQEFIEYAVDVLMFDEDNNLSALDNYDDIVYYLCEYLHELDEAQSAGTFNDDIFLLPNDYNIRTISDIKSEVSTKLQIEEDNYAAREILRPYYSFNSSAAAAYATKYAINYNTTQWNSYYPYDCTNFVSQAVRAGGIPLSKPNSIPEGTMDTIEYWYSIKASVPVVVPRSSTSWINVEDFYSWAAYTLGASCKTYNNLSVLQQDAVIGDVVQLRRSGESDYYHSIIITSGTKGNFNYCGHTSNRDNRPLSDISDYNYCRLIHF